MRGTKFIEWFMALLGASDCLGVAILFASQQPDSLWPAPGVYLIEVASLGIIGLICHSLDLPGKQPYWGVVPWAVAGALLAFVILGGFSIGPYLIPATLGFWAAGAISDYRHHRRVANHIILSLLVMVLQGAMILALLSIIHT